MRKKIVISFIILLFLLMIFGTILILFIDKRDSKISLIKDNVVIEYGDTYNPKIGELIDLSKYSFINLEKVRTENTIENEKDKDYPAVGEYEINVYYKNKVLKQKIEVIDTIAPELSIQDNIELEYGTDLSTFDFKKYITASDLSELNDYNIDLSKIDSSVSGECETIISIEDVYGNKTEKNLKIKILDKVKEIIEKKSEEKVATHITENKNKGNITKQDDSSKVTTNSNNIENKDNITNSNNNINNTEESKNNTNSTNQNVKKCTHSDDDYKYNSEGEAIAVYKRITKEWGNKVKNGEITYEEYVKKCPYGYETLKCPYCEKWTISFYYE